MGAGGIADKFLGGLDPCRARFRQQRSGRVMVEVEHGRILAHGEESRQRACSGKSILTDAVKVHRLEQ